MTQQTERDALRKLAEAATPGPWAFGTFHRLLVVQADKHGYADKHSAIADIGAGSIPWDATADSMQEYNDAEYIAAANPAAVITLLDQLQSQAERIKELESEVEMWKATANAVVDFEKVQLRAEIAAIAATEPVAKLKPCKEGWFIDLDNPPPLTGETIELFTRPMPAESKDAERYRWLRDYLISPSTHFDDLIVSADKADTLDGVIDAARAK